MKTTNQLNSKQIFEIILQLGIVFLVLAFCAKLLSPFVMPILWAIIFAIILFPIFNFLQKKLKGRKSLASFLIISIILVILFVPAFYFFSAVTSNILDLKTQIETNTLKIHAPTQNIKDWPIIGNKLYDFLYATSTNLEQAMIDYREPIVEISKKIAGSIVSSAVGFLQIILSIIIAGVFMVSSSAQKLATNFIMRIAGNRGKEILNISTSTVQQVVKGILGVAVIQTIIQAIGLFLCGVPFAGILTLVCLMLSIIQIGPIIVNIGVIVYLFSTGDSNTAAIFWTVYFFLSGLSDNVLKPILLGKGAVVPMLVIFLGVIGGFIMSGFIGMFVGPIVFSIGYKLFASWLEDLPEEVNG
ncbi:MAG: AI-2E family transporter [Flavobacterium sp.]|nr:AI-2E family transporter [Flavobacterium sp.]